MSLAKAMPVNIKMDVAGNELEFRTIGLDVWSGFSDYVIEKRAARIRSMPLDDAEKLLMLKELAKDGVDMLSLLTEAQTVEGMTEIVSRCCVTKGTKKNDLVRMIPVSGIASLFARLSDIEQGDESAADEVGNESSDPKNGA